MLNITLKGGDVKAVAAGTTIDALCREISMGLYRNACAARLNGEVVDLRKDLADKTLKVPHMGWNSLQIVKGDPLFKYFKDGEYVYYVHSFYARNCLPSTLGTSQYGNVTVTGVVRSGNVWGTQFHPEKSGDAGLRLLRAFSEL